METLQHGLDAGHFTLTNLYFPREDGSVTHVRIIGGEVISVEENAPVVIYTHATYPWDTHAQAEPPIVQWIEQQEPFVPRALIGAPTNHV